MSERILSEFDSFESAEQAARRILGQADTIRRISIYPRREIPPPGTSRIGFIPPVPAADCPEYSLPGRKSVSNGYGYYEPGQAKEMLLVADMEESDARNVSRILRNAGGLKINSFTL